MTYTDRLKTLLNTWGLADMLPLLQDEKIGVDELRMMKSHHINKLLHSHKMGTRIRFEYFFELWSRDQNIFLPYVVKLNRCDDTTTSVAQTLQTPHIALAAPSQEDFVNLKNLQSRATATNASDLTGSALTPSKDSDPNDMKEYEKPSTGFEPLSTDSLAVSLPAEEIKRTTGVSYMGEPTTDQAAQAMVPPMELNDIFIFVIALICLLTLMFL